MVRDRRARGMYFLETMELARDIGIGEEPKCEEEAALEPRAR